MTNLLVRKGYGFLGSSNERSLGSKLIEVPDADIQKWGLGLPIHTGGVITYPLRRTIEGIRVWTVRHPYASVVQRNIGATVTSNTLSYDVATVGAPVDSWVFVNENTAGQGNLKKVDADAAQLVTIEGAWSPNPTVSNGRIFFITRSYSIHAGSSQTVIKHTGTAGTPNFTAADIGRTIVFLSPGHAGDVTRRITATNGTDQATLDDPLFVAPTTNAGFIVLDGAGAAQTLATITDGATLQDLTINLNNAPAYWNGDDHNNWDGQPAPNPRSFSLLPIVSSMFETMWELRAQQPTPMFVVQNARDSAFISPYQIDDDVRPFYFGWQKDITGLDYNPTNEPNCLTAFKAQIRSCEELAALEGYQIDWDAVFILLAENDSLNADRLPLIGQNMELLRDNLRSTVFGGKKVKWIMTGPSSPLLTGRELICDQLQGVVKRDLYSAFTDTRVGYTYINPTDTHLTAASQTQLGRDRAATLLALNRRIADARILQPNPLNPLQP